MEDSLLWASERAWQVRAFAAKLDDLSLNLTPHGGRREPTPASIL